MPLYNLIPASESIPAVSWIFLVLNVFTFILHIMVINVAVGGTLIGFFTVLFTKKGNARSNYSLLAPQIPVAFAIAINLGVAPLLFLQVLYGQFFYSSSILMAVFWIMIIPLLILAYYISYYLSGKYQKSEMVLVKVPLIFVTIILLYIAFVFVNNLSLMLTPDKWTAYFPNRNGKILYLSNPILVPRYLHFLTASIAVAGLFRAVLAKYRGKQNQNGVSHGIKDGLKIFSVATTFQIPIGLWFFLSLPTEVRKVYMGENIIATIIFIFGILLAIGALISGFRNKFTSTLIHLLLLIPIMAVIRAFMRFSFLRDYFTPPELSINPQTIPALFFFFMFLTGIAIIWYLIRVFVKTGRGDT